MKRNQPVKKTTTPTNYMKTIENMMDKARENKKKIQQQLDVVKKTRELLEW